MQYISSFVAKSGICHTRPVPAVIPPHFIGYSPLAQTNVPLFCRECLYIQAMIFAYPQQTAHSLHKTLAWTGSSCRKCSFSAPIFCKISLPGSVFQHRPSLGTKRRWKTTIRTIDDDLAGDLLVAGDLLICHHLTLSFIRLSSISLSFTLLSSAFLS